MIVLDTSVVVAFMNRGSANHVPVRSWMESVDEELVTTPLAVAEMDYLVSKYGGSAAAAALWRSLETGAYLVEWWPGAIQEAVGAAEQYASLGLGLTDASLVVLAGRLETSRIATLDERHFRAVPPLTGEPAFTLLPADAG